MQVVKEERLTRDEWLKKRLQGIGASEIASVIGLGFETPAQLFARKVSGTIQRDETFRMQEGLADEPKIAARYTATTGWPLKPAPALVARLEEPWQMCSPDRLVKGLEYLCELKAIYGPPNPQWGEPFSDQIPENYLAQVQWQMGICGSKMCDVAANFSGYEFRIYRINFDPELFGMLTEAGREFWARVQACDVIDENWESTYADQLSRFLNRSQPGLQIELSYQDEELVAKYESLRKIGKEAYDESDKVKQIIIERMGLAERGNMPSGGYVSRKNVQRKAYTVEPCSYTDFRVYSKKKGKKS